MYCCEWFAIRKNQYTKEYCVSSSSSCSCKYTAFAYMIATSTLSRKVVEISKNKRKRCILVRLKNTFTILTLYSKSVIGLISGKP